MSSFEKSNSSLLIKKKKLTWTYEEDELLINWICTNGPRNWSACSKIIKNRTNKQIRERWLHSLNPIIKKGFWTVSEDYIIYKLYKKLNSQWSKYQKHLPGRTQISIKNRFFCTLRTKAIEKNVLYSYKTIQQMRMTELLKYFNEVYNEKTAFIDKKIEELKCVPGRMKTEEVEIFSINEIDKIIKSEEKTEGNSSISEFDMKSNTNYNDSAEKSLAYQSYNNLLNMKRLISISKSSSSKSNIRSINMSTDSSKRYFSISKAPKHSQFERRFLEEMQNERKIRISKISINNKNNEEDYKSLIDNEDKTLLMNRLANGEEYDTAYNTTGNSSKVSSSDLFDLMLFQLKENENSNEKHLINDLNDLEDILNTNSSSLRLSCFNSYMNPSVYDL